MIGVSILGTGAISRIHVDSYSAFPDRCAVRSLCDRQPEKAQALAQEKELPSPQCFTDYRQAVDRNDIDLVSICLPPSIHAEAAVFALNSGKHVLIEKPMACSLEECDMILDAARANGKMVSVVAQNRFLNPMMRLRHVLSCGEAGKILHAAVNSYWWRGENYYDLWWRGTWEQESGGCTINHAVHHADLLLWMMGMPEEVQAFFTNLNHQNSETEDFSASVLKYKDGSVAQLTASLVHHGEEQEIVFQCEKARISFPWKVAASTPLENGFPLRDEETEKNLHKLYEAVPPLEHEGHTAQIDNMLASVETGSRPAVDGEAGKNTLELIFGIYKSAQSQSPVTFPIAKDDPFYRSETMLPLLPRFYKKTKSVDSFSTTSITLGRNAEGDSHESAEEK